MTSATRSRVARAAEGMLRKPPQEMTRRSPPKPRCVHRWIEEQARLRPDAVAVVSSGESLTYAELNARANRLARRLRAMGVGPEVLVGLCAGRSARTVVGLLAILKAGGAYVPLDPAYPAERIAFMLQDAQVSVLLTEERLRDQLPNVGARILCLDSESQARDRESAANLDGGASAGNLAYVIYTSGSTGKPKGVQITHGALANLLQSMRRLLSINERDALLAVTTLSFDIAALEIFLPLIVGARVELIDRDVAADGARLVGRLNDPGITFLQATPATWRLLLEAGWQGQPALTMLCGGEALPRALADRLLDKGAALWNVYGPTETTIWSSACRVEAGETPISIGRPIANTQFYVLDKRLRAVPVGVIGELYIGGSGLARGYRHRAGLTAARFIPDPFGATPGGRLYWSGDLARWRADGTLECLGRIDHQVKIRGYRVELGEIEAALARHPGVREAAVAARPDASGETGLAAYIVVRDGSDTSSAADLRRWLQGHLPDYMVPSAFVSLEALPLTPNGKVDRQALPDPAEGRLTETADFVPPRGPVEEMVASSWGSLLGVERVGAHDNFFDLGGHSLLATQVVSRLREAFGVEIPLRALFESPTIAGVAAQIDSMKRGGASSDLGPIEPTARGGALPLSFSQEALWFLDQLAPGQPTFNVTAALRIVGQLDRPALERSVNELARRHESLRTTFGASGGSPYQLVAPDHSLNIETVDLSNLPLEDRQAEATRRAIAEARRPFDLNRGPLARISLLRSADAEHMVLLTMHHLVTDGWSFNLAGEELMTLYQAFRHGRVSPLPILPIQYADFARWQREQFQSGAWTNRIERWKRRLAGVPPLELPTDRPRPPVRRAEGAQHPLVLSSELSDAVRALSRSEGVTPFMTLLAAFQLLLGRWSGQDDFAVGSPVANRTRAETERVLGYFVNMLAFRADLSGNPTVREFLSRVREVSLEAFENQEIPLEVLIPALKPDRDASRSPLFQVMFILQNNALPEVGSLDLTISPLDLDQGNGTSKFDLALGFEDYRDGFAGSLEFNTDLFEATTINRFARQFVKVLEGLILDPERRLSEVSLLCDQERQQVVAWSRPRSHESEFLDHRDRLALSGIHGRFETQVEATPDRLALVSDGERLNYAELNARANRLARHLRSRGARRTHGSASSSARRSIESSPYSPCSRRGRPMSRLTHRCPWRGRRECWTLRVHPL